MKAMIAMSGGVDSSVAAYLMKERGYDCIGCTMKLYDPQTPEQAKGQTCGSSRDVEDARAVAQKLGIPYAVFGFQEKFRECVIRHFISSYETGRTPNPCIECNRFLKFGKLFEKAGELGCEKAVTGHYVRTRFDEKTGRWQLLKAVDPAKDQSYVLYFLTQKQLAMAEFPLGTYEKAKIRQIAEEQNFVNAKKHDSQDICFVPDGDYAAFIERQTGKICPEGDFVTAAGEVLGRHKGVIRYTIGQRKGLGIASTAPLFVTALDVEQNQVILSHGEGLFSSTVVAEDVNLISCAEITEPIRVKAKIRYRHKEQPATARMEQGRLVVTFDEPQRAVTKGQALVLYDGDIVVGGGTICKAE